MFANTPVRRLYQPHIERCWDCGDRKVAIVYQAKTFHGQTHYRWLCQDCGRPRCIFPSLILLTRIQEQSVGKRTNVVAFPSRPGANARKARR